MNCRRCIPVRRHTRFVVIRWLNVEERAIVGGRFTFRSGSPVFSVTGFVSFVELTTVPDSTIVVTIVTFLPDFRPVTTVSFCGDLTTQLFLNDFATVNFTQGPSCATALAIFVDCCGG